MKLKHGMKRSKKVFPMLYQRNQIGHFMVKMAILLKNQILEKIKEKSLTDKELLKILAKEGNEIPTNDFNKTLLDLEIMGLITVSWLTKDTRSIEFVKIKEDEDEYDKQIKETEENNYEASFPNAD